MEDFNTDEYRKLKAMVEQLMENEHDSQVIKEYKKRQLKAFWEFVKMFIAPTISAITASLLTAYFMK